MIYWRQVGTILATIDLIQQLKGEVVGAAFLIELSYLKGREEVQHLDIYSLVQYE